MKVCPQCDDTYHDDELNFCLMDGTPLAPGDSQPTVAIAKSGTKTAVMPAVTAEPDPTPSAFETTDAGSRHGIGFWIGIFFASIAAVTGVLLGGTYMYFFFTTDAPPSRPGNRDVRPAATPKTTPPKPSPTPPVATS
jgi:hypothetical protein